MRGRAVVVGAGIGGLCTAIGLHRIGWSVQVLERWPQVVGTGAALGIWPQARHGLDAVGLAKTFDHESVPVFGSAMYRSDGRTLLRIPDDSPRLPPVRLISRRRLMNLLMEQTEGLELRTGVAADEDQLRAAVDEADVLVGADGLRSGVRTTFFAADPCAPRPSGLVGWRGFVDFESGAYGETWGDGALFGNTPMEPGRTNFYAAFRAEPDAPGSLADLRERFSGWREPIPRILAAADEESMLHSPISDLDPPLRSFVAESVALVGDAAHAMTPHIGRGACEAITDAGALVARLADADSVAVALRGYDRERRPAAQKIAKRSRQMMRIAHARGATASVRNGIVRAAGLVVR